MFFLAVCETIVNIVIYIYVVFIYILSLYVLFYASISTLTFNFLKLQTHMLEVMGFAFAPGTMCAI